MQLCIQLITIKFSREFLSDTADTDSATANTELYTANPEKRHRKLEKKYDITITLTIYFYVSDKIYSKTTSPPSIACHTPTFRWEKGRGLLVP